MGATVYITSYGELTRSGDSLLLRTEKGKVKHIPVEEVKELFCLSEITVTSKALELCGKYNITVHVFGYYGNYAGTFCPPGKHKSGLLTVKQALLYSDENSRNDIARAIVLGIGANIRSVLYRYYSNGCGELKPLLDWLKSDFRNDVAEAQSQTEIMAAEAMCWQKFYGSFSLFLGENFLMEKRVRRPPDNPLNAMISFGNTLLYSKTVTAIYQTSLCQTISFLHSPSERRNSLSLDLSEAFKPVVVFRTIFTLVNRKQINAEKHFDRQLNACLLNEAGKLIFVTEFEKQMESKFMHPVLKREITYRTALKMDAYKLMRTVLLKEEFAPFLLEEMK